MQTYIIPGTKKNEKEKLEIILNWIKIEKIKICTNQNLPKFQGEITEIKNRKNNRKKFMRKKNFLDQWN